MKDSQKKWLEKISPLYKKNYKTAISGRSRTAAIKAKCLDCVCWQRKEITLCPLDTCPLWPYRPYQKRQKSKKPPKTGDFRKENG